MIPQINIISGKASNNRVGESWGFSEPLSDRIREQCPLRNFLGSKEHLHWFKTDFNATKIITVPHCKCTKN